MQLPTLKFSTFIRLMDGLNMGLPFPQIMALHHGPLQSASSNLESGLWEQLLSFLSNLKLFEGIKVQVLLIFIQK